MPAHNPASLDLTLRRLRPGWAGAAVNLDFTDANQATGFKSGNFGTPYLKLLQPASGFSSTAFGTPAGVKLQRPAGFSSTAFGQPGVALKAVGFTSTAFGVAAGYKTQRPTGFSAVVFGTARIFPYNVGTGMGPARFGIPSIPLNATGFLATNVGAIPVGLLRQRPTGFTSTVFGNPVVKVIGVGFKATKFGLAHVKPIAVGFSVLRMGTPTGWQHWNAASLGPVTGFSTAYYAFNQTGAASGFKPTRFGLPGEINYLPVNPAVSCQAFGFTSAVMGTPSAGWRQTGAVTGWAAAVLGTPTARSTQAASGLHATQMGAPRVKLTQRTTGAQMIHFGTPTARLVLSATGLHNPARFGLPSAERGNTYKAYGFTRSGRFGQPQGFSRFSYRAAGFNGVRFGSPTCAEHHRAAALPPCARFGRPLLKRIAQC